MLHRPYTSDEAALIVREMADQMALDLCGRGLVTEQITLTIGYDTIGAAHSAEVTTDRYGRKVPRHAHGTAHLPRLTSAASLLTQAADELYAKIIDPNLPVRRITITAERVTDEMTARQQPQYEQLDLFTDYEKKDREQTRADEALRKEDKRQKAMVAIRKKYGNNAILKGMNFKESATMIDRNGQVGGHKA